MGDAGREEVPPAAARRAGGGAPSWEQRPVQDRGSRGGSSGEGWKRCAGRLGPAAEMGREEAKKSAASAGFSRV